MDRRFRRTSSIWTRTNLPPAGKHSERSTPNDPQTLPNLMPDRFCSDIAREGAVGIHGSATEATHWLCIEHPSPWAARELSSGSLPVSLVRQIDRWESARPGLRVQAIRREVRQFDREGEVTVLLASSERGTRHLRRIRMPSLESVAELDVPTLLTADPSTGPGRRLNEPVVLTCTNGKRDACCALKGRVFHEAMAEVQPAAAWQATHLGGHRFAPTAVVLPFGHQYGWLDAADAPDLWQDAVKGHVWQLDRYRGWTAQPRPAQAAAIALRQRMETLAADDIAVTSVLERSSDAWQVDLTGGDRPYRAWVQRRTGRALPKSCGGAPKPAVRYDVTQLQATRPA